MSLFPKLHRPMKKISRRNMERIVYVLLIIVLVIFGMFKDSGAAEVLIQAVKDAFSILIQ